MFKFRSIKKTYHFSDVIDLVKKIKQIFFSSDALAYAKILFPDVFLWLFV